MEAKILSFRRNRHTQYMNQFLLEFEGSDSKEKAVKFVGKKVVWKSPGDKQISGKIASVHGNKGAIRAIFERGLPGQAIGQKVEIA